MIDLNKYYISSEYQGASGGSEGRSGFVPKALSGDALKFLRGDGTWQEVQASGQIFGNIQILSGTQTTLSANVFSSFFKIVTANNSFTFTNFVSGVTIAVYLSGNHSIPYRQYFPANTYFNNNGQANYVYTFPNKLTKAVIQNIGDRNIGITNIITTDVPSITSTGNIILDGLFGLLLAENRTTLRQEPI